MRRDVRRRCSTSTTRQRISEAALDPILLNTSIPIYYMSVCLLACLLACEIACSGERPRTHHEIPEQIRILVNEFDRRVLGLLEATLHIDVQSIRFFGEKLRVDEEYLWLFADFDAECWRGNVTIGY